MIQLALLRHGHTSWNREGRLQGRSDICLDDSARTDLASRQLPVAWRQADIVASPLRRATETAALVTGRAPRIEMALIEMNWGAWEGQYGAALSADPDSGYRDIEHWGWDFCPPEGEPPSAVRARVVPWAQALEQDTVAVCHIGTMRVLLAVATGWQFLGPPPFRIKRNRLFVLTVADGVLSLSDDMPRLEPR